MVINSNLFEFRSKHAVKKVSVKPKKPKQPKLAKETTMGIYTSTGVQAECGLVVDREVRSCILI